MPATQNNNRKMALLLSSLSPDVIDAATSRLSDEQAKSVRSEIESIADSKPSQDEVGSVLDEFTVFMKFALETAGAPSSWSDELLLEPAGNAPSESEGVVPTKGPQLKLFQPTDDPLLDLQKLEPAQIAIALEPEQPKTIAVLLASLGSQIAADVLSRLSEEVQPQVFFALQQKPSVPEELLLQLAKKAVERAAPIEPNEVVSTDGDQETVDLLRALPKAARLRLMEEFEANDPTAAQRIRDLLYLFEDIAQYDNRSIQKILGQCDTQFLVVAMQGVEESITDRIFENLSKRAASALREELEFQKAGTPGEIEAAQNEIAQVIAKLDTSGDLTELR